jgi:cytochrome c oxidase subunit 2
VASRRLTTANELHIPVGREVKIRMRSADVIHSFWAPQLHGKRDLIPGDTSYLWLKADRPGRFQGQCAEFCGHQHAHMRFEVVAHSPERFAAWYESQLRPAATPTDSLRRRGQEVFVGKSCVMCHRIRGTIAGGTVAPDLTHVASRRMIAAGTLPNTRGYLGGWIVNPQSMKPGVKMPPNALAGADLQALLAYLESLK